MAGTTTLADLNASSAPEFERILHGVFEHAPWVARFAYGRIPFASVDALHLALMHVVHDADAKTQLELLRGHPELARPPAAPLTASSQAEQDRLGLRNLDVQEASSFATANSAYRMRFGFPFIIAARGLKDRSEIIPILKGRLKNNPETEIETALQEVGRIARFRLDDLIVENNAPAELAPQPAPEPAQDWPEYPASAAATPPDYAAPDYAAPEYAEHGYAEPEYAPEDEAAPALFFPERSGHDMVDPAHVEHAYPAHETADHHAAEYAAYEQIEPEQAAPEYAEPEYAEPEYAEPEHAAPGYEVQEPVYEEPFVPAPVQAEPPRPAPIAPAARTAFAPPASASEPLMPVESIAHGPKLTTHVLDSGRGCPAVGLRMTLARLDGPRPAVLGKFTTGADGRPAAPLLQGDALVPGLYELAFHVAAWHAAQALPIAFYDTIPVQFRVTDPHANYHVPLILSPFGYSTYRGS